MKIRSNYVSNSSSSSYVIACKGDELADKVLSSYDKLVEYWKETHENDDLNYFDTYYMKDTAENIINNFSEYFNFSEIERNYLFNEWKEKEKEGYVLLYGTCSNESDINGYMIMNMFNEYILYSLSKEYNDINLMFDRRGS